jgi:hypothetical protein
MRVLIDKNRELVPGRVKGGRLMGLVSVDGRWTITQSNGFQVIFDIDQRDDGELRGSGAIVGGIEASGEGRLDGAAFVFTVDWNNDGSGGRYEGQFDPEGHLSGVTFDLAHPQSQATWFTTAFDNVPQSSGNIDGP